MNAKQNPLALDHLALGLSLAGVVLGVLIAMVGRLDEHDFAMHGYGMFVAFSVAAIVLGIITRTTAIGMTALSAMAQSAIG